MHHQLVLPDAGGGKGRQKEKKVRLGPTRYSWNHPLLCWICCSSRTNANSTPLPLSRHEEPSRLCRKPKARRTLSLPGASQRAQPAQRNQTHHLPTQNRNPEQGSDYTRTGLGQTAPLPAILHLCSPWKGRQCRGKGTAAQDSWHSHSLTPKRSCSQSHLDSSPVASTPKCSHTAGQNCSLQVMKSSSRLARTEESQ